MMLFTDEEKEERKKNYYLPYKGIEACIVKNLINNNNTTIARDKYRMLKLQFSELFGEDNISLTLATFNNKYYTIKINKTGVTRAKEIIERL